MHEAFIPVPVRGVKIGKLIIVVEKGKCLSVSQQRKGFLPVFIKFISEVSYAEYT